MHYLQETLIESLSYHFFNDKSYVDQPPSVCRGCTNRLSNCNAGVDIFSQEGSSNSMVENKVKTGIEMITGLTVS